MEDYQIVKTCRYSASEHAIEELEKRVRSLAEMGWKPQGGVVVILYKDDTCIAFQAMVM